MPTHSYLITGIAGTGKSTLKRSFEAQGYETYDIDDGFVRWVNRAIGEVAQYGASMPMTREHDWLADIDKIRTTQDAGEHNTYFFGSAHNLFRHTDIFRTVFLLSYPDEQTLRTRIMNRTDNDYGKQPGEIEDIIDDWKPYEQPFVERGATVIDCTLPCGTIIDTIRRTT